ncbi:hypothetical protein Hamer_G024436 [Homarus americanus]|uniref:Uncharacterized protein n=1 Tax=Homarus americanus TaxID=6706 RepID=A0A8J5MLM2_HOMAM|nr:hypothetical protein Hamer_G024436 [Homarus americanus]
MGSPSSISTFWLNFTNKRKNSHNESMWSRFHSPYDPPTPVGSDHCEFSPASSPVASSRHLRVLQSLPPVSPRPRTPNGGFWRSPSSSSGKKSHPDCHTHPSALTAGEKENDTPPSLPVILRRFFGNSQKNTIQERVRRAKLRLSRSAEVLDDLTTADDPGCWGPKRRNSEMSKSTDELQKIKIRWMQKLDQCRVQFGPCKSDESFNIRPDRDMDDTTPDLSHIAVVNGQQSNSLSLNKIKKKVLQTPSPSPKRKNDQTTDTHSQRHKGPMSEDQKSGRRCEDAREQLDTRARGRTRSPRNANDGKDAAVIFTVDDQPPLTVRPGVSLTRSRSCTRPSRRALSTYSEPDYNSPTLNMRSTASSTLDDAQKKHAISEGDLRLRRSRSSQRPQPTKTPETDEEDLVFEPIPQVPELKLFRYNSERRSSRADRLKALSIFNHQPLGYLEEQTYPQNMSYSPEGRVTTDRDTYTTLQTPKTPRHILDTNSKTWSAKRSLFRSSSVRPGTEDPLSTSPFLSLLAHKRLTRGSLSDKVVLKQLASTVVNEDDSGLCRGLIFDGSTSARTGVFPASLVARRDTNGVS